MRGGGNMMKQAMALQANMKKAQEEIAAMEVIGESGGGMVKVTMNGKHEVKRVQIEPQVASEDREMLEDLIAAAFNDALNKAEAASQARMSSVMSGINLPPGFKMPFLESVRCSTPYRSPGSSTRYARCRESAPRPRNAWPFTCCRAGATVRARWPRR